MYNAHTHSTVAYVKIYPNYCNMGVKPVDSGLQTLTHP